ncbi:MAG: hypothetical protein M0Z66_11330 [Thermaerobacter sp.]|nr:hypothetical protein [Thermaerobacter sp.]
MQRSSGAYGAIALSAVLLVGCSAQGSQTAVKAQTTATLTPTKLLGPTGYVTSETLRAPLTGGPKSDELRVTTAQSPYGLLGTLTITSPSGKVLRTVPHIGWVGVLEFGRQHLPVFVTRSDAGNCGSGGCYYVSYRWVPTSHRFAEVRVASNTWPSQPQNYAWDAKQGRFHAAAATVQFPKNTLWGFLALTHNGLRLVNRTFDLNQNYLQQDYVYLLGQGPAGAWQPKGQPVYGPATLQTPYPSQPLEVAEALMDAVALNLPRQAKALASSPAAEQSFFGNAHEAWGPLGEPIYDAQVFDAKAAEAGKPVQLPMWEIYGTGAALRLHAFSGTLQFAHVSGQWHVSSLSVAAIPLKVATVGEVLSTLRQDSSFVAYLRAHPGAKIDAPIPQSATVWRVGFPSGAFATVDARTGAVTLKQ